MISEFKIQTSNFAAENYKGPIVISTITKSGGRDFHGMGYMFARHFAMNANDAYNNKLGIKKPREQIFLPWRQHRRARSDPRTGFNKNRDKLFFFAGYEYFKQTSRYRCSEGDCSDERDAHGRLLRSGVSEFDRQIFRRCGRGHLGQVPRTARFRSIQEWRRC